MNKDKNYLILTIENRISLLSARTSQNGKIINKLNRRLRKLKSEN